jgi:ABC-type transport system involved in multi-copper enzyme maturation permease subunit
MLMIIVTIFLPVKLISAEVDNHTLDVMLSYPIRRWRYIFEKFSVYLTYNLLYPILMLLFTLLSAAAVNETITVLTFTYSVIGVWFLFFALGSISLLCGALFLKSKKALTASGIIIFGQYILVRVGGMVDAAAPLKYFSLLNYLNAGTIVTSGTMPIGELLIVITVGVIALLGSLYIFQKRELAF